MTLPIAEHGLIGDLRSAALVGTDGTVDWFCPRRFDAPSVFASLLDDGAGHWSMAPTCEVAARTQFYYPDSAVLVTRFLTEHGIVEVQDLMPIAAPGDAGHEQRLVRRVVNVRGTVGMRTEIVPRFDYGRETAGVKAVPGGLWFTDGDLALGLGATVDLSDDGTADFDLAAAFSLYALLRLGFTAEAQAFVGWLTDRFAEPRDGDDGPLRVMYTIDGDPPPAETELAYLSGYRGSAPVLLGTERATSCSSTCTARSSTRSTCSTSTATASRTATGRTCAR